MGFNELDLLGFKSKNPNAVLLLSDESKNPGSIMGKNWQKIDPQNPDQVNELVELARKKQASAFGILNGVEDYLGLDFEWSWIYRIWCDLLDDRSETYTVQTANGGKRPVFQTKEVSKDWGEPFKNTVRFEIKNKGYVILGGKAKDIMGNQSQYKVVKDLPIRRDDNIIKDTIETLKKIYEKAQFLGYKCIQSGLDKKMRLEHDQRLALLTFMLLEEWPDDAIHNFFMDVHEKEGRCDYKQSITQTQIDSGRSFIAKGGKPKACKAKDGATALYQVFNFDSSKCEGCLRRKQNTTPNRFFLKKQFIAKRLSEEIQEENKFLATSIKSPTYYYNIEKGIWENTGSEKIDQIVKDKLNWLWKTHYKNEAENHVRACNYQPIDLLGGSKNKIVMLNGVYDLETESLEDFNPDYYEITRIPVNYNPDAACPKIDQFLIDVLNEKDIPTFYEIAGYCLYKGYTVARLFIFYGKEGKNGKSKALGLIDSFLGHENTCSVNLQSLTDDGFKSSNLHGKLANICGDIPGKPIEDTGLIKKITGGDKITLERKYFDPFDYYCYTKLIFSANEVPDPKYDKTGAFYRRVILIEFPNEFRAEDPKTDPNILDKITTPDELSGFFNKAISGLKNLLKRGYFVGEKNEEERKLEYMREANNIQYFAELYATQTLDPEIYITNEEMYRYYCFMCNYIRKMPKSSNVFSRELRRYITYADQTQTAIKGKQTKVWRGVVINLVKLHNDCSAKPPEIKREPNPQQVLDPQPNTDNTDNTDVSVLLDNTESGTIPNNEETPINQQYRENRINRINRITTHSRSLQEKIDEARDFLGQGVKTPEELAERMGIALEGVDRLLSTLERDGIAFQARPGVWKLS